MAGDKTLLSQIDGLTTNQALKIQIELADVKRQIAPDAKGQSTITETKNLNGKTLKELAQKGSSE
ncbi:MAG: hypothetical protein J6X11_14740 [Treponema sp.]|nr:hypothetical protein [Treponema sp.]HBB15011.1 hypothetical protein [Treponema sp.]